MAELIRSSGLLEASSRLESAATVSHNLRPPTIPERASEAAGPAHFDPQANLEDSGQFRADILRRYEAPFTLAWRHGGLND
jgi:hypothetical protein